MRIAGIILAGGQGRRMGREKALVPLSGVPLIARVLALAPQVEAVAISANGDPGRFGLGLPVLPDRPGESGLGPMAGIRAGLDWAAGIGAEALVSTATDTPFLPEDLVERLAAAAPAHAQSFGRDHYTAALWRVATVPRIDALFAADERRIARLSGGAVAVPFDTTPDPFANLNTPEDLARAEDRLRQNAP
uniref:Molybdenum cofactor guanylyltransferase n=1 Tax=Rhodobacter capsulatus TaxID=1061 RepID=MOBA_RHOCA|nr:RecName: Full=Molybdenum cofactor guanylyltransferase; Short=MoCo guanylyltransferase; AltName: Full=GTP:molybdopterin guanylyltransferase; AltName: Full=Mo-MPT guanylyltransferase; AltName: Full=Molybdopterin guanylyltransferase; AltName: Full=Molybdopterin-guanine dinucleotide synthase; Short=MGD synthase [Rhodobacter capsulatus]